ncbi:MAG: hypothetical protein HW379_851 [Actinobacteria bacterium]|nr:hypothetical protein [Actinomycetota bacterium]
MKRNRGLANPVHAISEHASPKHASPELANPEQTLAFTTHLRRLFRRFVKDEKGSAIVEFVVLAIPLFVPIFIYLASFASLSGNEAIVRTLAREALRAYVASENDHAGREVSAQALAVIADHLGLTDGEIRTLSARYECSENPCLSANGRIRLTISYIDSRSHRTIKASAQEHISPWM